MSYHQESYYLSCQTCPDTCLPQDLLGYYNPNGRRDRLLLNLQELYLDRLPVGSNCSHNQDKSPSHSYPSGAQQLLPETLNIASTLVIWESCNLLTQRQDIAWIWEASRWTYRKPVKRGQGELQFWLQGDNCQKSKQSDIYRFDIRSACLHLIYAAQATQLTQPWNQTFSLSDRELAHYLGLQRRRDLNQQQKLKLLEQLIHQVSRLSVAIRWPQQGDIPAFEEAEHPLWELVNIDYHYPQGAATHPNSFTLSVRPGQWARHFLNPESQQQRQGFYQTTSIQRNWIELAFRNWQQHPGMVRSLFWLIFKLRFGRQSPLRVCTFMTIAYGAAKLERAESDRDTRKRLIRTFERDLELLAEAGLTPQFDPKTYLLDIRPLWAKLQALPDDLDDPSHLWLSDNESDRSLLDFAPRGKWKRLKKARFSGFGIQE